LYNKSFSYQNNFIKNPINSLNNLKKLLNLLPHTSKTQPNNITSPISYINNFSEVRLHRVRFKPGYQRIWREARSSFKELLNIKFLYQQQLTKYFLKFLRKSNQKGCIAQELILSKLVLYSRILPDNTTFILFYTSKNIYINGITPILPNLNCVINDFIQFIVSKWYYIFYR
jgi:hypothetical protein